ncbi:MAG: hypothetical protein IJ906_06375 [Oscillospiraceae bacterium]|nr:hypothetical protein [Oscillospiraceae bacterium]
MNKKHPKLRALPDDYYVDIIQEMAEKTNRRAHILNIVLACLVLLCILVIVQQHVARVRLEREFETEETYEYDVDQETDDGGDNYFVGRDFFNGQTKGDRQSDEEQNP